MNADKGYHLEEKQIIMAVVDESDLPLAQQEHLVACPKCRTSKERLEQELAWLSHTAELFAPHPQKQISLSAEKPRSAIGWFGSRRALGVALTAAFVIIVVWWFGLTRITPEGGVGMPAPESWETDSFMTEIGILVENALPQEYRDISGEYDSLFEEECMQFFVPSIHNNSLSLDPGRKGERLC